jgi:hypothetical protein
MSIWAHCLFFFLEYQPDQSLARRIVRSHRVTHESSSLLLVSSWLLLPCSSCYSCLAFSPIECIEKKANLKMSQLPYASLHSSRWTEESRLNESLSFSFERWLPICMPWSFLRWSIQMKTSVIAYFFDISPLTHLSSLLRKKLINREWQRTRISSP